MLTALSLLKGKLRSSTSELARALVALSQAVLSENAVLAHHPG